MKKEILRDLEKVSSKEYASTLQKFFKTGKGEYGYGDVFVGIKIPSLRSICKKYYRDISFEQLNFFTQNRVHEYRLFAFLILTYKFEKATQQQKKDIYEYYIKHLEYVNNWDIVDLTAHEIVGQYLIDKDRKDIYELLNSDNLWKQRVAVISTYAFIRNGDFKEILSFAKKLLTHEHDLIHKAVGWMLRNMGKKDINELRKFLDSYATEMPRTMLRYAIERLEEPQRKKYLHMGKK